MLTKNLTPFLLGTKLTSLKPPMPAMSVVVRATFALKLRSSHSEPAGLAHAGPGEPAKAERWTLTVVEDPLEQRPLSSGLYADDDDERLLETTVPDDFADWKPRADVLLKGHCHTPRKSPLAECPVVFKVGHWSKSVRVSGPRVWTDQGIGAKVTDPQPFTRMSLGWSSAFGGPGYAKNPAGKGYRTREAPNLTAPRDVLSSSAEELEPAGFGPINPAWPQRAPKVGKQYGADWKKTRAPFFAADFDWSYFNEAPADQSLEGYLRGDETLFFQNLHADAAIIEATLPGLAVRAFVRRDGASGIAEVPLVIDTLFADLDASTVSLTWRGVTDVADMDFDDVKTLLVASEAKGEKPRTLAEYEALLARFEGDPSGLKAAAPPGFYDAKKDGEPEPDPSDIRAYLDHKLGSLAKEQRERAMPALERALADATKAASDARPTLEKAGVDAGLTGKLDLASSMRASAAKEEPPVPRIPKPGTVPNVGIRRRVRRMMEDARSAKEKAIAGGAKEKDLAKLAAIEGVAQDPRWRALDPHYTPPEPLSTDEPGPGADLRDRDLSDTDLSGRDLRGANLEGAVLSRASLRGANLDGARLLNAVLFRADLSKATLNGADLTRVNAARVVGVGASFHGANIDQAFFDAADLTEATFERASGDFVVFTKAKLTRATLRDVKSERGDFTGADLSGVVADRASVRRTHFTDCVLAGARFIGGDLSRSSFTDAKASGADFTRARLDRSIWLRASAERARFDGATLRAAFASRLEAIGATFERANLANARLDKAKLDRARFADANLFEADLSRSRLHDVSFERANLYGAKLLGASGRGAKFLDANLKRAVMEDA